MQAGRDADLRRLVASVEKFCDAHPGVPVHHVMLLQRCEDAGAVAARLGFPDRMEVTAIPRLVPLSIARNIMINTLVAAPPFALHNAMVAFPDDDAWYPDQTLAHVHGRFQSDPELEFWFCRYGSDAAFAPGLVERAPSLQDVISKGSSNTITIRGRILDKVSGFDESLGLGTPARSGEDTDFGMRAFMASRKALYAPYRLIGHRDFEPAIRAKYYAGTLVALGRHKFRSMAAAVAFLRKILVGLALVVRGELAPGLFAEAWKMYAANAPRINPDAGSAQGLRSNSQGTN